MLTNCSRHGILDTHEEGGCPKCWKAIEDQYNEIAEGLDSNRYYTSAGVRAAIANLVGAVARQERRKGTYRS